MGATDYYLILGISRNESAEGVREAFRELAFRYHPDRAGPGTTGQFQEIAEAFQVLSDPHTRAAYDRRLDFGIEEPIRSAPVPRPAPRPLSVEPLSLFGDFHVGFPSAEEIFERLLRNFTHRRVPKSESLTPLDVDLILTPEEARWGGSISIAVPVFHACDSCGGTGRDSLFPCLACHETGIAEGEQLVELHIPPMVRSGSMFDIPLHGIQNLYLRARIQIGG
jgi:molecular chaperone DnaJ